MTAPQTRTLPPDYHTHNLRCKHAQDTPVDYARAAVRNGVKEMACTDHCPTDDNFDIEHRMELSEFPDYLGSIEEAQKVSGVTVLRGVEADYYPGCEKFLGPFLSTAKLDIVLGSVHYLDYWAFDNPAQKSIWNSVDTTGAWSNYFDLIMQMVNTGLYDIASHLDLPKKFCHRPPDAKIREMVLPVLDRMAETGMGLEINTSGALVPAAEFYPSPAILTWAAERNLPLSFGSDSHIPGRVGDGFPKAVALAREVGFKTCVRFRDRKMTRVPLPES